MKKVIFRGCFFLWKRMVEIIYFLPVFVIKCVTPIKQNKIMFICQDNIYNCNPKYIYQELNNRNLDIEYVFRCGKDSSSFPKDVNVVRENTIKYFKELFSSKIVIANTFIYSDIKIKLKKEQMLLQTWHGSLGIKKWGKEDMKDSPRRIKSLIDTAQMTSYIISNSDFEDWVYKNTFFKDNKILKLGHARNDVLFKNDNQTLKEKYCKMWNISTNTKLVLYAPTFRDGYLPNDYDLDYDTLVKTMKRKFNGDWKVIVRLHPSIVKHLDSNYHYHKNVINGNSVFDCNELLSIIDAGITDYSSWIYDFIITNKPAFIYATDIDEYIKTDRNFYYPIEDTPFSISKNNKELMENIIEFDEKEYINNIKFFLKEKGSIDDGCSSKRIVDFIIKNL